MTALLELENLTKHFAASKGRVTRAVDGISLTLAKGEALAIVGESGCGKSTAARLVMRLIPPTGGAIRFRGEDITRIEGAELRRLRRHMQIVFQNPHAALDPRKTIYASVAEPLLVQGLASGRALAARTAEALAKTGLPGDFLWRYPHELSGGQKQRACIARALILEPELVVLDEPTSALDVSVQAQILELLAEIQRSTGAAFLFISHNLAAVRQVCGRVAVMYLGRIVEEGPVDQVFAAPRHPYTRALIASVLPPRPGGLPKDMLGGDIPDASAIPPGCRFAPRCPLAVDRCREAEPELEGQGGRRVACYLAD